jgi:hypothetical protein
MLSFSILYPDLIKISSLYDTLNEGFEDERRPKRQGDFMNNLNIYTYMSQNIYLG